MKFRSIIFSCILFVTSFVSGAEVTIPENFVLVESGTTAVSNGGIQLPYDVLVGKYEVTCDEFDAFCNATRRRLTDAKDNWGRGRIPVTLVTGSDAVEYANWLSQQDGFDPA